MLLIGQVAAALGVYAVGSPLAGRKWPPRYAVRRIAWHALDHAWEMEDRTEPGEKGTAITAGTRR